MTATAMLVALVVFGTGSPKASPSANPRALQELKDKITSGTLKMQGIPEDAAASNPAQLETFIVSPSSSPRALREVKDKTKGSGTLMMQSILKHAAAMTALALLVALLVLGAASPKASLSPSPRALQEVEDKIKGSGTLNIQGILEDAAANVPAQLFKRSGTLKMQGIPEDTAANVPSQLVTFIVLDLPDRSCQADPLIRPPPKLRR